MTLRTSISEAFDSPAQQKISAWVKIFDENKPLSLYEKVRDRWRKREDMEVSKSTWNRINTFNASIFRGANFKRMQYYSKWLIYRTSSFLHKIYPQIEERCFPLYIGGRWHMDAHCLGMPKNQQFVRRNGNLS